MKNARKKIIIILSMLISIAMPLIVMGAQKPDDTSIRFWVEDALREDSRVNSLDITVEVKDGIVTLSGDVVTIAAQIVAEQEAKKISGVKGVINKIFVKPVVRFDTDIYQDIRHRFIESVALSSEDLHVKVDHGEVTLSGTVSSPAERKHAGMLAREVIGVAKVNNKLRVSYKIERPDNVISDDVTARIQRDVYLTGLPIRVSVAKGIVTLEGEAGSVFQKERAGADAWVYNVNGVKNNINVKWWENEGVRQKLPKPSDADLQETVRKELNSDLDIIESGDIRVEAKNGLITLRGNVLNYYQKQLAGREAQGVAGVIWVNNLLKVTHLWRTDAMLRWEIQYELNSDAALNGQEISISVNHGGVTLTGSVNTFYEKDHAGEIASRLHGVREVINNITVAMVAKYSDDALQKRIKKRLAADWETGGVADKIKVTVKNGMAILSGEVDTWADRVEATQVAFHTDGVWGVDNELTVQGVAYPWDEWYFGGRDPFAYDHHYEYDYDFLNWL